MVTTTTSSSTKGHHDAEHDEQHHHVAFAPPNEIDTYNHDEPHQRIESPPPPPNASPPFTPSKKLDTAPSTATDDSLLVASPVPKMAEIEKNVSAVSALSTADEVEVALSSPDAEALPTAATPPESSSHNIVLSSRSTTSQDPPSTASGGNKFHSLQLRGNLTRTQRNRDPLQFYEITQVLGIGSMGSVAKVKKRAAAIGGSARPAVQERVRLEHRIDACFNLPVVGGWFAFCLRQKADAWLEEVRSAREEQQAADGTSTILTQLSSSPSSSSTKEMIYAMKSIHLSRITDDTFVEELRNEISILKTLDHPHIVKAIETFDHRNRLFVIMELCSGGDLYSRDPYTEEQAARITSAILGAISYMHSKGILHRDLKYENILFANESPQAEIKLIDFGLSKMFGHEELTDGVGTIYTMAPEVLKGKYTKQADLWSVGVIAYMLMSSQMPFYGRKREHIVEQIMAGRYEYKGRRWKKISKQGKAFVDDLLVVDPDDRADTDEAMRASWLNRRYGATVRSPHMEELDNAKTSIKRFANYSKLRKVALMVVAHKSTSAEIGILRKVFQEYDKHGCGQLTYVEFKAALNEAGYTDEEYRQIFDAVDLDGTGHIRYTEFLAATIEAQGAISEERLAEAFDRLDSDDSGYISADNLREILGEDFPKDEIEMIIKEASKNGQISYSDFLALWEEQEEKKRDEIVQEITVLNQNRETMAPESDLSVLSNVSSDHSDVGASGGGDFLARSNFIEGKNLSERRIAELADFELKPERQAGSGRHVMFADAPVTIPSDILMADTSLNGNEPQDELVGTVVTPDVEIKDATPQLEAEKPIIEASKPQDEPAETVVIPDVEIKDATPAFEAFLEKTGVSSESATSKLREEDPVEAAVVASDGKVKDATPRLEMADDSENAAIVPETASKPQQVKHVATADI